MSPERWQQVEEIFSEAVELPAGAERASLLAERCGEDGELRAEVERLIAADEAAGDFIAKPAFDVRQVTSIEQRAASAAVTEVDAPMTGRRIGSYKVVREIGRGGMGSVYLAVRADDEFHKRVAIKLVKRGMDTDFVLKRFRNERQILASLDHPNIGHLLDGGTTDDGLPYFVMEYIQGQPVDRYCDNARLTIAGRLKLFRQVCSALSYAHQNLIIHRDIKPSNILVTPDGAPKLLDFGIAKILNPEIAIDTIDPTLTAMRMMTPKYASPEQLRGGAATNLSDVYSLGVLLYELLTGRHPYRLRNLAPHEVARLICEEDPERPSAAAGVVEADDAGAEPDGPPATLDLVSRLRSTTPEALRRDLSRGLDQIVMKAMRKDPLLRYQSVEEFSEDVRRYLDGSPVTAPAYFPAARRPSGNGGEAPTAQKSIAVLPFKLLHTSEGEDTGGFLGVGLADALITRLSNTRAFIVRPTSAVMKFAREGDPVSAGRQLGVDFVLDGHILRAGQRVRVSVQLIGTRQSAPLWAAHFDEEHADILALHDSLSEKVSKALVPQLTGEERRKLARRGTNSPEAYEAYMRGRLHWNSMAEDGFAKAILHFNEAAVIDPSYAAPHAGIADYYNWLGVLGVLPSDECYGAAKEAATRAAALDPSLPEAYTALGFASHAQWDWEASDRHLRRAIELNPNHAPSHQWYSFHLASLGRFDEAVAESRRAIELDPNAAAFHQSFAFILYQARRYEDCLSENEAVYRLDPDYPLSLFVESRALCALDRCEEALAPARKASERSGQSPLYLAELGYACAKAGRDGEAREILARLGEMSKTRHVSHYHVALIHVALGEHDEAFARLERAYEQREAWLVWVRTETPLDPLRSDPRFESLLRRVAGAAGERNRAAQSVLGGQAAALLPAAPQGSRAADPTLRLRAGGSGGGATGVHVSDTGPRPTDDEEAYTLYKVGRYYSTKRTAEDLLKAVERFEHAVARDPSFALAYAELADCYSLLNWYAEPPPEGAWDQARRAALKAVEADDQLPEAHASLGFVLLHYDRDWAWAEREFRRAVELKADNAVGHRWLALCLSAMGRHEEAVKEIMRAREILPRSAVAASAAANILFFAERYEEALGQCYAAMEIDPGSLSTHIILRWCYERLGMCEEALAVFEQERAFAGETPMTRAKQAHVLASCGHEAEAREVVGELVAQRSERWVTAYEIAVIYALLGERDEAFAWLGRAEEEHAVGLTYVGVDPRLNSLRDDPRFRELMARVSRGAVGTGAAGAGADARPDSPGPARPDAPAAAHVTDAGEAVPTEASPLVTTGEMEIPAAAPAATQAAPAVTPVAKAGAGAPVVALPPAGADGDVSAARPAALVSGADAGGSRARGRSRLLGAAAALLVVAALAFGLYSYLGRSSAGGPAPFRGLRAVKVTASGNVRSAAVSPDGKLVAYVVDEGGRRGLLARQVAVSNNIRLVPPSDLNYFGLAFSRDGTYLYFVAAEREGGRGDLYRVPALGGSVQKLRAGVDSPVGLSHDGKRLAFVVRDDARGRETLYVADLGGANEREVAAREFPEHFSVNSAPAFSPDDERIALVVESSDANGFFLKAVEVAVEGGSERPLSAVRWSEVSQMRWLETGEGLLLAANDGNSSTSQLWSLSYPGGAAVRLTEDLNDYRGLSLSKGSEKLVTVQGQTLTNVFLARRGDYARPLQITSGAGRYVDLSWTPDARVLFATDASGNADVWEMAADGGDHAQLTAGAGRNYAPVSTPDGRHVLFHSNRSGKWQVWRMNRDGSGPVRLTQDDGNSNWPAPTPDGRFVVYERTSEGSLTNLYKIPLEGGEPARLTGELSVRPAVSPDGRLIAHWYKAGGPGAPWQIALTPAEGGPPERIFDVPQNEADGNSVIRWTGDGRGVVYTDYKDGVTNLRLQPVEGGPARQITNATREVFYSFDLAPDGRLLLANGLTTGDVVLFDRAK